MDPDRDDAARLRRGDTAGLTGLLSRYQDRLFRYLLRLVGDEAVAEDVFQQTWIKVAERIGGYDRSRPFAPWLFTVARNLALDDLRRRHPESLEDVAEPQAADLDPLAHREVLTLRFEEDLELPQLAATLGVPLPTAKARLYRALTRLRERLLARGPAEDWR